jgi:transcriptional regulator with XRE-family HTH domain
MPANPLTPEELLDAARLKALFVEWQDERKLQKKPSSQEAAVAGMDFSQSALSQYLNGGIPLNLETAYKFAKMLGKPIAAFSPSVAEEAVKTAHEAMKFAAAAFTPPDELSSDSFSLECETSEEIGLLAAYRLAGKRGDTEVRDAYDAVTGEFLAGIAAKRKKV